jgi:hypothetical protein
MPAPVLLVSTLYSLLDIVRDASSERADFPAQVLGSVQVGPPVRFGA